MASSSNDVSPCALVTASPGSGDLTEELRYKKEKKKATKSHTREEAVAPPRERPSFTAQRPKPSFTAKLTNRNPPIQAASSSPAVMVPTSNVVLPPHKPTRKKKTIGVTSFISKLETNEYCWKKTATKDEHYRVLASEGLGGPKSRLHNALSYSIGWVMANFRPILDKNDPVYRLYTVSREYTVIDPKLKMVVNNVAGYLRGDVDFVVMDRVTKRWCVIDIKTTDNTKVPAGKPDEWLETAVMKCKNVLQLRVYSVLVRRRFNLDYTPECYILGVHIGETKKGFGIWKLKNARTAVDLESALGLWKNDYRPVQPTDFADT